MSSGLTVDKQSASDRSQNVREKYYKSRNEQRWSGPETAVDKIGRMITAQFSDEHKHQNLCAF